METKGKDSAHTTLLKANQDHFDEQATKWDDDPEYVKVSRTSYATIMHHLGRFLSSRDDDDHPTSILNFGCGTGLLEAQLRSNVTSITGIDISDGMILRMNTKIQAESWTNVTALQMDILDEAQASLLPIQGFDMIISCYTFHHLQDVTAVGGALLKYLKPGGYLCIIDFAAASTENNDVHYHHTQHDHQQEQDEQQQTLGMKLSEAAKASIGSHDGFSKRFLIDYYQSVLDLENVTVEDATPVEYPTVIAYGQKKK
ncbi:methyltransferase [Skeletonema marinoi]|uniref:Methyltransferase n=1 Tax=Skeletonema marinoi TaxID=267567 RepID=A0AAD9DGC2_9STRA|nr:methyltransferase [Skeletonema marinoi]